MPMPYSHYVLAQAISKKGSLPIKDRAEYLVGAFMPDIRYFTQQPREKYHFPVERLEPYFHTDTSKDYLLGYKVHLLIDEVWEYPELKEAYKRAFPPLIRQRMTRGFQALAFEMYCLRKPVDVVELKPIRNDLTEALEISTSDIERAVSSMRRYLEHHDLEAALTMAEETQLFPAQRLRTVVRVVRVVKNPLARPVVDGVIAKASRQIFSEVTARVTDRLGRGEDVPFSSERERAARG